MRRSQPAAKDQSRDGRAEFEVSADRMTVTLTVSPPTHDGKPLAASEVLERIWDAGIAHGLDEDRVRSLVARCIEIGKPLTGIVAEGTPPVPGSPPRFEVLVHLPQPPTALDSGDRGATATDYHFQAPILNVNEGQEVARKTAATDGVPGTNVFGEPVAAPAVRDHSPRPTFRITTREEGPITRYIASEAGELRFDQTSNTFYILTEYVHKGDVTVAQGDIVFVRDVAVAGNVVEGAVIRAGGNVHVVGTVGAATIEAGGKVTVSQGVVGGGRGRIIAGGDVDAAFAENACIRSGGDVVIRKGVLNSDISASGSVLCSQGRGSIIGGITRAGRLLEVRRLGAPTGVKTEVMVGFDWALLERRDELRAQIATAVENVRKFDRALGPITSEEQLSRFPQEIRANIAKALQTRVALRDHAEQLRADLASVQADLAASPGGVIKVTGEVFAGVRVRVRDAQTTITDTVRYCIITEDRESGEVRIGSLG